MRGSVGCQHILVENEQQVLVDGFARVPVELLGLLVSIAISSRVCLRAGVTKCVDESKHVKHHDIKIVGKWVLHA